jgi:hypothetical protein
MNVLDMIVDYETGVLNYEDTLDMYQELINTGLAWRLQGHYGRTAQRLIEDGYCYN